MIVLFISFYIFLGLFITIPISFSGLKHTQCASTLFPANVNALNLVMNNVSTAQVEQSTMEQYSLVIFAENFVQNYQKL